MLVLGFACGFTVFLACGVLFASLAFWLRGARSFTRDLVDFVVLFSMYPGSIWQGPLRLLVHTLLPAGFIVLMPVRLLRQPGWLDALVLMGAALAYAALAGWVFRRGLRRYRRGETPAG
jgi:ABC-2 type transport system permease protein